MKVGQSPSLGKNSDARVVLPAPFGPAIMRMFFSGSVYLADGGLGCTSQFAWRGFHPHPSPLPVSREGVGI